MTLGARPMIGVDFSGAQSDSSTWVTQGRACGARLALDSCAPMPRERLAELLASSPGETVAALDFPYSVPWDFAQFWQPGAAAMPSLWQTAADLEFKDFLAVRDRFVARSGEPLRRGDLYFPECYSPLHKFNPNMVPMTFRGMQMLHRLWGAGCRIAPLPDAERSGALLLESMPGAVLRAFGLPFKGYKNGRRRDALRRTILEGLEAGSGVEIENLAAFEDICLRSHDCLDSVIAAVAATLWAGNPRRFRRPGDPASPVQASNAQQRRVSAAAMEADELDAARLEGWLYAPRGRWAGASG